MQLKRRVHLLERAILMMLSTLPILLYSTGYPISWIGNHGTENVNDDQSNGQSKAARQMDDPD